MWPKNVLKIEIQKLGDDMHYGLVCGGDTEEKPRQLFQYWATTLTYQKYLYRPKFPFTFSHIYLLIKESTH